MNQNPVPASLCPPNPTWTGWDMNQNPVPASLCPPSPIWTGWDMNQNPVPASLCPPNPTWTGWDMNQNPVPASLCPPSPIWTGWDMNQNPVPASLCPPNPTWTGWGMNQNPAVSRGTAKAHSEKGGQTTVDAHSDATHTQHVSITWPKHANWHLYQKDGSTYSLTSALDGVSGQLHALAALTPVHTRYATTWAPKLFRTPGKSRNISICRE